MKVLDAQGKERDAYFEFQKYSFHLRREFISRQVAIQRLFDRVVNKPGGIVELGVRNGANFFYLARLLEIFNASQRFDGLTSKQLIGFDTFAGFPSISEHDTSPSSWHDMRVGGVSTDREVFFHDLEEFRSQTLLTNRIHIYEGCVEETIDRFLFECPGIRVSMLFFDLDLYEPTKFALQRLWPLLVAGGVAVFDQYGFKEFPGESQAVDEFFAGREVLESFPWCANPAAFIIKK